MGIGTMNPSGPGSYNGYPGSDYWAVDSRPLSEATNVLRSFVTQNIVQDMGNRSVDPVLFVLEIL